MGGGSAWVLKSILGEQDMRAEGHILPRSSQVSSPPCHEWVWQEGTGGGQWKVTGQMGCGVSWEKTDFPREDSHTSWSCLDIFCFSRIPRTRKVNVDMQGRATRLPQCVPVSGWNQHCTVTSLNHQESKQYKYMGQAGAAIPPQLYL